MSGVADLGASYDVPPAYAGVESQHSDLRPTLLVTTVDIGGGAAARVEVRQGDDPADVARAFCARHGLPEAIVLPLAQHLEENLAETNAERAQADGDARAGQPGAAGYPSYRRGGTYGYEESESEEEDAHRAPRRSPQLTGSRARPAEEAGPLGAAALGGMMRGGATLGDAARQRTQQQAARPPAALPTAHHLQVEPSPRSASALGARPPPPEGRAGPRPATAGVVPGSAGSGGGASSQPGTARDQGSAPPTYRPAALHSARGAEYFNHPAPSGASSDSDSEGGRHGRGGRLAGGAAMPAHSRLYADHFRKQQRLEEERRLRDLEIQLKTEQVHIAPASNKLAAHRTAGSYRNYGERLYVEGRLEAMKKEQLAQRAREEEARAEMEQYSFQPEISRLAQQLGEGGERSGAYQRLYQRNGTAKRQERMEAIKREQEQEEVQECSFRPHINSRSARMMQQRQQILKESGVAGYEQLFADSARRRAKLEELAQRPPEEATFRPKVNTSSVVLRKLLVGQHGDRAPGSASDVAERLLERGRRYQEKVEAARQQLEEAPRDAATGQPLFKPKTHRPPTYERNPEGAPIGEYLYSIKAEWEQRAERLQTATRRRSEQSAATTFVNSRSERLVDRLKRERFRAIFDYLRRGDPAPLLNLLETVQDEAFMDTIDPEVRADIEYAARLLERAVARRQRADLQDSATSAAPEGVRTGGSAAYGQSTGGELEAAGFVSLMEDVLARTKGLTRQYLLPMPSTRQKFEEPTFRPALDPHSMALASRLRPDSLPAYELLYRTAEEQAAKREEARRAADAAKLRECLFRPVIVAQPRATEGRAMKLAADLRKKASEAEEGPARARSSAGGKAQQAPQQDAAAPPASGGDLQFDALERQINEALVRLSLSEEQVAASLRQAEAAEAGGAAPGQPSARGEQDAAAPDAGGPPAGAGGYRLDLRALCGSSDDLVPMELAGGVDPASSLGAFNPLDDEEGGGAAVGPSVAWDNNSREVVAQVVGGSSGELAGLDLQALASADLPLHGSQRQPIAA